jgi:hypothetical protein
MPSPTDELEIVLSRTVKGRVEWVHWMQCTDAVWVVSDSAEIVVGPEVWPQTWSDLREQGFVVVWSNDPEIMAVAKNRILDLVRTAFQGVSLGQGVGLLQAQGLDDYADERTLAAYRAQDEQRDWSAISVDDLDQCSSSLCFLDDKGMRFHLPAYLVAELQSSLNRSDVLFHLVYADPDALTRFDALSATQDEAVRQFLFMRLADKRYEFQRPMIEAALKNYWIAKLQR